MAAGGPSGRLVDGCGCARCSRSCSATSASRTTATSARGRTTWGSTTRRFWLVSRGGDTFMSVRGLDVWGHHVNLIAFAFAPAYWLGAGPEFLYVVQAGFARARRHPGVPHRPRPARRPAVVGSAVRRRLPDVRADPVDQLGDVPPGSAGDRAVPVRVVVRDAAALAVVLRRCCSSCCRSARTSRSP